MSFTFSLFIETPLSFSIRLASPLVAKIFVFSASNSIIPIPFFISSIEISACGTPSKTDKSMSSDKFLKVSVVPFPNKIVEASTAAL